MIFQTLTSDHRLGPFGCGVLLLMSRLCHSIACANLPNPLVLVGLFFGFFFFKSHRAVCIYMLSIYKQKEFYIFLYNSAPFTSFSCLFFTPTRISNKLNGSDQSKHFYFILQFRRNKVNISPLNMKADANPFYVMFCHVVQ